MTDRISKFDFDKVIDIKYIHYIPGDIKAGKNQRHTVLSLYHPKNE